MTNRKQTNKDLQKTSSLDDVFNTTFYVNVYGDTVIDHRNSVPYIFNDKECEEIQKDIFNLHLRVSLGEELTFLEKLMLENMKNWN